MSSNLVGKKIIIRSNEFVHHDTNASIVMVDAGNKFILLALDEPLITISDKYQYVVASPRLSKDELDAFNVMRSLSCSVTWVPDRKYNRKKPMDLSWWRGGAAAVTDLCVY
ncbi:hypothetical protein Q4491_21330 [Photobacterium sp. 2_MG-2023]|uniref:hypothetical protein n=1 Tax=Photobacterium sp. 2_MG-2023 TaxID=3062663 RepID=UPI0026E3804B|nr:hypothetical protein [Photobacterium sp. 2_MG-2023]MDO6583868.1 hypothetical protein [Photobacterium sp. 2_MG-2023]